FAGDMLHASVAARHIVELAGIGFGIGDELRNGLGRNRWMYHQEAGFAANTRYRHNVVGEIEGQLLVERGADRVRGAHEEEGVAVRGSVHDGLGGDDAARTRPVFDDELLTESFREPLAHQACIYVESTGRGKADD